MSKGGSAGQGARGWKASKMANQSFSAGKEFGADVVVGRCTCVRRCHDLTLPRLSTLRRGIRPLEILKVSVAGVARRKSSQLGGARMHTWHAGAAGCSTLGPPLLPALPSVSPLPGALPSPGQL